MWLLKFAIAWAVFRPLVKRNYRLRRQGKLPDEWYWADAYLLTWGKGRLHYGM